MNTDNLRLQSVTNIRSLLGAGLASMAAAVIANLILRTVLLPLLDLPRDFPPLQAYSVILFTIIGTGLGVLVYALVVKRSANPKRTFLLIAVAALILSILPNFALMINPSAAPFPGGSPTAYAVLIIFHLVAAVVFVPLLIRLSRLQ